MTIIEGRDRIGGRLYQERLGNGRLVDMGPNWIHGTDDNPMLDLAKQTGTAVGTWDLTSYVFNEEGSLLPVQEGEAYATLVWDIIQDAFIHSNKSSADIDASISLLDFFKEKVVEKIPESEDNFQKKRETVLQMSEMWGTFVGSAVGRQSLKFFWLEECIEGGKLTCVFCVVSESSQEELETDGIAWHDPQRTCFAPAHTKRSCKRSHGQRFHMPQSNSNLSPTRYPTGQIKMIKSESSSRAAEPWRLTRSSSHAPWGG